MEISLTRNDILWLLEFLNRTVPRGAVEEEAAVRLIAKLSKATKRPKSTT